MTDQQVHIDPDVLSPYVLAQFVRACIVYDRKLATAAAAGETGSWERSCEETGDRENAYWVVMDEAHIAEDYGYFATLGDHGVRASHIARWDPAHVLAECEVKAKLVDLLLSGRWPDGARLQELRLLGALYADRPGYREEWRP